MPEARDQQPLPNETTTTPKKPNRLTSAIGKIALAGSAILAVGIPGRAAQAGNPAQPIKDAVNISREIKDAVTPDKKPSQFPQNSSEPTDEIGSALSVEKTDLEDVNRMYDTFVSDLSKIPGAIMMGMGENVEGYKISINDETYQFIKPKNQNSEKTLSVENNNVIETIHIKDGQITKESQSKSTGAQVSDTGKGISEEITTKLRQAYNEWVSQRVAKGENITSSTQIIPGKETSIVTPEPSTTPIPTPTPEPYNPKPNPLNRDIQETTSQQANDLTNQG